MKKYIEILLAGIVSFMLISGCGNKEEQKAEEQKEESKEIVKLSPESIKEIKLETEVVALKPFTGYITLPAKVITNQDNEALIGSLVQGRVHQVFVRVGDYVKAGQKIMTVEGLDIGEIKAGFLKAKAANEYAKANYERQKKLYDEKIGSQKILLESQAEYEKTLAEYKAEDKKIHSIGLSDEDVINGKSGEEHTSGTLQIKSPISGIVVERNVVIGQLVDATTNAFRIINTSNVWIDGQIYEKDLPKINQITNAVFVTSAYPDIKFDGKISYIGQVVDEKTRTITIRSEFNNLNGKLKPQMFGEIKLLAGANVKAIMISEEAVVKETNQDFVLIQKNDTTFEKRIVKCGATVENLVEIKEGLQEGEKVVSKGVFYLKSELKKEEIGGDD